MAFSFFFAQVMNEREAAAFLQRSPEGGRQKSISRKCW